MPLPFSIDAATPPQTAAGRPGSPAFGEAVPVLRRHLPLRRLPPHGFPQDHPAARPGPAPRQTGRHCNGPPAGPHGNAPGRAARPAAGRHGGRSARGRALCGGGGAALRGTAALRDCGAPSLEAPGAAGGGPGRPELGGALSVPG